MLVLVLPMHGIAFVDTVATMMQVTAIILSVMHVS